MRDRASLILFIFIILIVIILAQNGTLGNLFSGNPSLNLLPTTFPQGGLVSTVRPLVFSTSVPANNVYPTPWGPTAYVPPAYAPAYAPTDVGISQPVAGGSAGVVSSGGQCIVPNGWAPYTIQAGETLATIASSYNLTVDQLSAANCLDNPDLIYAGQVIAVPGSQ